MKFLTISTAALTLALAGCASNPSSPAWRCEASGLVNSHYTGGEYAMVHLSGFSSGGQYKVQMNAEKTVASGSTANGTPFKCFK